MRKPLIAGNWKMNLNHLEAIAVTQKLAYSLEDRDYDAVEVVIIPPFTDIRSVQTLVDGDRLRLLYGAQDYLLLIQVLIPEIFQDQCFLNLVVHMY